MTPVAVPLYKVCLLSLPCPNSFHAIIFLCNFSFYKLNFVMHCCGCFPLVCSSKSFGFQTKLLKWRISIKSYFFTWLDQRRQSVNLAALYHACISMYIWLRWDLSPLWDTFHLHEKFTRENVPTWSRCFSSQLASMFIFVDFMLNY